MKSSDKYATTGVKYLDDQHKMLFKMTDDFRIALNEHRGRPVYKMLLDSLEGYASMHFSIEEGCMERYRCPVEQANRAAHGKYLEIVATFQQCYTLNGFDRADAGNLIDTIEQWLEDHFCRIDAHLKQCMNMN